MRIKLPLFDNPTVKKLHHMSLETELTEGVQRLYVFPNGFGASVVQLNFRSPGRGLISMTDPFASLTAWELGVIEIGPGGIENGDFELSYDTEVAEDVLKPLSPTQVEEYLQQISQLASHR